MRVWDVAAGKEARQLAPLKDKALCLAFLGGDLLASGDRDGDILLWDVKTGQQVRRLVATGRAVSELCASPDGKVLASAHPKDTVAVRLWDVSTGKEALSLRGTRNDSCVSMAFSRDGKLFAATGHEDFDIQVWEVATGKKKIQLGGWLWSPKSLAFSPDGKRLAAVSFYSQVVHFWDVETGQEWMPTEGHLSEITALSFSPDGKTLASAATHYDRQPLRLWDAATGKPLPPLPVSDCGVEHASFSSDGKALAALYDLNTIHVWDPTGRKELRSFGRHEGTVLPFCFAPVGSTIVAGGKGGEICHWSVASGECLRTFGEHRTAVRSLALSPDGKVVASRDDDIIHVWDLSTGKALGQVDRGEGASYAFAPDGRGLLLEDGKEGTCSCWDLATTKVRWRVPVKGLSFRASAFSPDGRTVAYGTASGEVVLLELATMKERLRLRGHSGPVHRVAFAPDGQRLASGGADSLIFLWDASAAVPREQPHRELLDEWRAALGGDDAAAAYRAVCGFAAFPERATSYLRDRLHKATPPDETRLKRWLAQLDDEKFEVREAAGRELTKLGKPAVPALRQGLEGARSAEVRRRAQAILDEVLEPFPREEELAGVRAVEVLERIGTPAAERLLKELADGDPNARQTQEAKAAGERLSKRRGATEPNRP